MDLFVLALSIFLVCHLTRLIVFKLTLNYPDLLEILLAAALGIGVASVDIREVDQYSVIEGVAAAGLALFLLELYVVALKASQVSIPRGRSNR